MVSELLMSELHNGGLLFLLSVCQRQGGYSEYLNVYFIIECGLTITFCGLLEIGNSVLSVFQRSNLCIFLFVSTMFQDLT